MGIPRTKLMFHDPEPFLTLQLRDGFGRGMPMPPPTLAASAVRQKCTIGMIRIATMLATLIIGLIAGPAVSL